MHKSRLYLVPGLFAMVSIILYLVLSNSVFGMGFPLDDSWIHQTYARNFASNGEWAFIPGQKSAGSTAPLWTLVLAIGYFFRLNHYFWAFFIGWICLWGLSLVGNGYFQTIIRSDRSKAAWGGIILALEWKLVWASASGMETIFFSIFVVVVLWLISEKSINWFAVGMVIGVSIWVRPDGFTLLGPAGFVLIFDYLREKNKNTPVQAIFGFMLFFIGYLIFNWAVDGSPWPNTFYAKQAEYAVELEQGLHLRIMEQATLPLIGVGVMLLPGFFIELNNSLRNRRVPNIAAMLWIVGFLVVYAIRLPVTYQHGRYTMPVIPVYVILCLNGIFDWLDLRSVHEIRRIASKVWVFSTALVLVVFLGIGAQSYARDVAFIETEMVAVSKWIASETKAEDLIAAHDIGALGYYGGRDIIDLAGLVSPEVIPIIRNEEQLAIYISDRGAAYLVAFPSWYPALVQQQEVVFASDGTYAPRIGGENMVVYRWLTVP